MLSSVRDHEQVLRLKAFQDAKRSEHNCERARAHHGPYVRSAPRFTSRGGLSPATREHHRELQEVRRQCLKRQRKEREAWEKTVKGPNGLPGGQKPATPPQLPRWAPGWVPVAALYLVTFVLAGGMPGLLLGLLAVLVGSVAVCGLALGIEEIQPETQLCWMVYQVTCFNKVGEDTGENGSVAWTRRQRREVLSDAERYPGDYPGRVQVVLDGTKQRPGHAVGETCDAKLVSLTAQQRCDLSSRKLKYDLAGDQFVSTTFTDNFGAVAADLVAEFGEAEAIRLAAGTGVAEEDVKHFHERFTRLQTALPTTINRTGTGLYYTRVTPTQGNETIDGAPVGQVVTSTGDWLDYLPSTDWDGGYVTNTTRSQTRAVVSLSAAEGLIEWTLEGDISSWQSGDDLDIYNGWDSVQGPCDQLNTDQGTATFTAEQEVRCYAGTYTENVTIPNTLDTTNAFKLVLAANSGDSVTITQIGISHTLHLGPWTADVLVRGMILQNTASNGSYHCAAYGGYNTIFDGVTFDGDDGVPMATRYMRAVHYRDCVFQDVYYACVNAYQGQIYDRCEFHGSGAPTALILAQASEGWVIARSCVFDGTGVSTTAIRVNAWCHGVIAENCTFYDFSGAAIDCETQLVVHNCIFKDCGYAFDVASPLTAAYVESDYNCFHGCTHIATVNGSDYTTLASWQALVDADSASPDANSLTDDPLLTDAANDDFSLMATSPCRYTGRGSGAVTGINSVASDPNHPCMGAWQLAAISAPTWTSNASNVAATDAELGDQVNITWDAVSGAESTLTPEYRVEYRTGGGSWSSGPMTTGTSAVIDGLTTDSEYELRVGARYREGGAWGYPTDTDTATPTWGTPISQPSITSIEDDETGTSATWDLVAGSVNDTLRIFYRLMGDSSWAQFGTTREGSGELQLTGLSQQGLYEGFCVASQVIQGGVCYSRPSDPELFRVTGGGGTAASDNVRVAVRTMKQDAVYWPATAPDAYGKPTYGNPTLIACRWDEVQEEFVGPNGDREVSRAKLIVDRDLTIKGVVMLGDLSAVSDSDDPKNNDGAWEIRGVKKTPDFKGKKYLREVYL